MLAYKQVLLFSAGWWKTGALSVKRGETQPAFSLGKVFTDGKIQMLD